VRLRNRFVSYRRLVGDDDIGIGNARSHIARSGFAIGDKFMGEGQHPQVRFWRERLSIEEYNAGGRTG
jgi:hypothetical protein